MLQLAVSAQSTFIRSSPEKQSELSNKLNPDFVQEKLCKCGKLVAACGACGEGYAQVVRDTKTRKNNGQILGSLSMPKSKGLGVVCALPLAQNALHAFFAVVRDASARLGKLEIGWSKLITRTEY